MKEQLKVWQQPKVLFEFVVQFRRKSAAVFSAEPEEVTMTVAENDSIIFR